MIEPKKDLSTIMDILVNRLQIKHLFSNDTCLLCHSPHELSQSYLCPDCIEDLPFNRTFCEQCALPMRQNQANNFELLCGECLQNPPNFSKTLSPFIYHFPVKQAIQEGKYNNKRYWLKYLSHYLTKAVESHYGTQNLPDLILPVPMHETKLKLRRFNQASFIANQIAKALNIRHEEDYLIKTRATESSSLKNKIEREKILENAFQINLNADIKNRHIALVDDVVTTKTTIKIISSILIKNGAKRVDAWCIARTAKR